jgi:hypothetical protein
MSECQMSNAHFFILGSDDGSLLCLRIAEIVKKLAKPPTPLEKDGNWWAKRLVMTALVTPLILPPL